VWTIWCHGGGGEDGLGASVGGIGVSVENPGGEKGEQQDNKRWSVTLVGEFDEHSCISECFFSCLRFRFLFKDGMNINGHLFRACIEGI
jgi:hypothetical protein